MRLLPLVTGAAVGAAAFLAWRGVRAAPGGEAPVTDEAAGEDWLDAGALDTSMEQLGEILSTWSAPVGTWSPAKIPAQYAGAIAAAEARYGLPANLLARVLWQESRYDPNARSPAGALGIAQFMPRTAAELGVDPFNPALAIDGAGRYLAQLYRATGNWRDALAAYNWGIGNLTRYGIGGAPRETRNYYTGILADLGMGEGYA